MGSTSLISSGERVLLDSVALIYYLGNDPVYTPLATEMVRRVVTGELQAAISVVAVPEVLSKEYQRSTRDGRALFRQMMTMPNVEWVEVTSSLADEAARLRAAHNLSTPDALHVATALQAGVDWLVTNDRRLRRVEAEGIRVWLFDEHVN